MGYAIIWTTTHSYMPGTNAILNAIEHYGFDVDVYVLIWDALDEAYIENWPGVNFIPIDIKWWDEKKKNKWYLRFADLIYASKNLKNYDVVLVWGADVCPVNNFMDYFEISHKLNKVIVGTNEHARHLKDPYQRLSINWPYKHHWTVAYADIPFFVPKDHFNVIDTMLDYQKREDCELSHMDGMNHAFRDCDTDLFVVPGELWVHNVPQRIKLQRQNDVIHFEKSNTRLNSFHRRYWAENLCKKYLPINEISRDNKLLFNQMWAWFNTEHRVKWNEGWQLWNGI